MIKQREKQKGENLDDMPRSSALSPFCGHVLFWLWQGEELRKYNWKKIKLKGAILIEQVSWSQLQVFESEFLLCPLDDTHSWHFVGWTLGPISSQSASKTFRLFPIPLLSYLTEPDDLHKPESVVLLLKYMDQGVHGKIERQWDHEVPLLDSNLHADIQGTASASLTLMTLSTNDLEINLSQVCPTASDPQHTRHSQPVNQLPQYASCWHLSSLLYLKIFSWNSL